MEERGELYIKDPNRDTNDFSEAKEKVPDNMNMV